MITPTHPVKYKYRVDKMLLPELPEPILLHPLKHHLGYLQAFVRQGSGAPFPELQAALLTIGTASQLDLYTGPLSLQQISEEVILYLQQHNLLAPEAFQQFLLSGESAYQLLTLSDTTTWVLRWGVVAGRHVHLHPARYAAHTIRVKANVLKTAVALALATERLKPPVTLAVVNEVRTAWLGLPPVKAYSPADGTGRLLAMLQGS
ncbi:hypothetical protein [Pontibacter liquoris]|uniref:hypothetical protein n=1 Tax=Pontibacter liquoris TaxID=2905677 RepID=UPI001FA762FE